VISASPRTTGYMPPALTSWKRPANTAQPAIATATQPNAPPTSNSSATCTPMPRA
jgi:hypothetical protein